MLARFSIYRSGWRVAPGLYRLGEPGPDSPVFVSANYRLSFDALRGSLPGVDAYILVLDTKGINVWCAAGKGTFSTDELVYRIERTGLSDIVEHRNVVLPQLGATGVAAHEVRERTGFKVTYGPVRAADLPRFMSTGEATEEMRRVEFDLKDRVVLIPVEAVAAAPIAALAAGLAHVADGPVASGGIAAAAAAGLVAFPALLPWLPSDEFSIKGFTLGGVVGAAAAAVSLLRDDGGSKASRVMRALSYALALPPLTAFIALNFTGATPVTSPTQVRKEIFRYVRLMAGMAASGVLLNAASHLAGFIGGRNNG